MPGLPIRHFVLGFSTRILTGVSISYSEGHKYLESRIFPSLKALTGRHVFISAGLRFVLLKDPQNYFALVAIESHSVDFEKQTFEEDFAFAEELIIILRAVFPGLHSAFSNIRDSEINSLKASSSELADRFIAGTFQFSPALIAFERHQLSEFLRSSKLSPTFDNQNKSVPYLSPCNPMVMKRASDLLVERKRRIPPVLFVLLGISLVVCFVAFILAMS